MEELKGYQKKYLKGLAHGLKPVVYVGQKGILPAVLKAVDEALEAHELIKVKFVDFKEKERKEACIAEIVAASAARRVGLIGHMAIFYRPARDPQKRKIRLPQRTEAS